MNLIHHPRSTSHPLAPLNVHPPQYLLRRTGGADGAARRPNLFFGHFQNPRGLLPLLLASEFGNRLTRRYDNPEPDIVILLQFPF